MQPLKLLTFSSLLALVLFSSCSKDNDGAPAPTAALSAESFVEKTGRTITSTFSVQTQASLGTLVITKTKDTDIDPTWENAGTKTVTMEAVSSNRYEYQFSYELQDEDADHLIGFNFKYTDPNGKTVEKDISIDAITSGEQTIYSRTWRLVGKMWVSVTPNVDDLKECEKDNLYTWNEDGTYTVDYGTNACDFDGFNTYLTWSLNEDETLFTQSYASIFDPADITTDVYTIRSITKERLIMEMTFDLTDFGPPYTDQEKFVYTYEPVN